VSRVSLFWYELKDDDEMMIIFFILVWPVRYRCFLIFLLLSICIVLFPCFLFFFADSDSLLQHNCHQLCAEKRQATPALRQVQISNLSCVYFLTHIIFYFLHQFLTEYQSYMIHCERFSPDLSSSCMLFISMSSKILVSISRTLGQIY
jgi:hypothetical protein